MDYQTIINKLKLNSFDCELVNNNLFACGNSIELLKYIPDNSISLILTDPPYHTTKKKNIIGDTAFNNNEEYIEWLKEYASEWKRILKQNGSIFCFCSSKMSAHLQIMFSEFFNVLSEIVWTKPNEKGFDGWKQKMKKENLRQWYPQSERIIFLENYENYFGSLLFKWRKNLKLSTIKLAELLGAYGKVNHGGIISNWEANLSIPSEDQYCKLRGILINFGMTSIPEYKDIIRPFNVNKNVEFTDIWNFKNVKAYKGKHPAEKPTDLLKHAICSTTYENDVILDCFSGSGSTCASAIETNRKCISFEIDYNWYAQSIQRCRQKISCCLTVTGL